MNQTSQDRPRRGRKAGAAMPPPALDNGACHGEDTDLFFPEGTQGRPAASPAAALAICGRCPVRAECLDWALTTRQDHGILGGRTADERAAMRRRKTKTGRARRQAQRGAA